MGASLAARLRGVDQVCLGFFGDGGANTGRVWEFVNLASLWELPLIVVCENNLYAVETHAQRATAAESIADRAAGFGLPTYQLDGQDVATVYRVVTEARERARSGAGPTFVEALTYRYRGHNTGDSERYRERGEVERWRRTKDPILRLARALELGADRLDELVAAARATVADAVDFAERSPWPDPETGRGNVTGLAE
jgi:pyruvate dehydrogenase E1 component alpha subunit